MDFRVLGPLEVSQEGHAIPLGGPKQRMVLVHLLLRTNHLVPTDRLIEGVWGEEPVPAARASLQSYVSHLRKALGPGRLEGKTGGYVLHADATEVDALRFESLVGEARGFSDTDPALSADRFKEALALWNGPALDDLADQPSLQPEIARLEELRLAATEGWVAAELDLGRHADLVAELETLTQRHPLREGLWAQLMLALYRSGRQGEALGAYRRARDILLEELGIDPSPELQQLHERILNQDSDLELKGEPLRGYRLLEQIGAGAFGVVHRAIQPQVGREVAVKAIHPRFANHPDFIRRFEAEAQLVARLEHPHTVPLYDYWRGREGAHLVMRFLRGGSAKEALAREGPLEPEAAARVIDQVALALAAAHRVGVIHRDVKPANILFDEEGNAYLSDFGIAWDLVTSEVARPGSPSSPLAYYLSPEEIRGGELSTRTDVYNLGLVLYELLGGRHPFAESPPDAVVERQLRDEFPSILSLRPGLPAAVEVVIRQATAKEPAERYSDAPALASAFRRALEPVAVEPVPAPAVELRNPYKGLRPFLEADAPDFFGREALTERLLARMAERGEESRFLAVVGPSGSGKSSVVRAGLIPALRGGALPGSDGWFVIEMLPGPKPFEELERALLKIWVDPPVGLLDVLQRDDQGLLWAAERVLPGDDSELVLVVDQLEELFTQVLDEQLRSRFLGSLLSAVTDPDSRVRVVATLRADFYNRPLSYRGFGDLLAGRSQAIAPLSLDELERAVSGPAEGVGVAVEPRLAAEIVAEVADQPGGLPLLQYALTELFERRENATLTLEACHEIGGVSGALARRAEALYGRLDQGGKEATRQLFLRLVSLGEERSEDTRRRVLRAELTSLGVDGETMETVIDTLGARRLLSFDRDPATRAPTVEVAHEALLSEWKRLRHWIEATREDLRTARRLSSAAAEWDGADGDPSFLLRGARLAQFEGWTTTSTLALTDLERQYIAASVAEREAERAAEEARQAKERALERRSVVRLRGLVAVLTTLALVASGLTVFAFGQRGRAEREASRAEREARVAASRELASAAVANLDADPELSILLSLEAVEATRREDGTVLLEAEEALHRAVGASRVLWTSPDAGSAVEISPDGTRVATDGEELAGLSFIYDLATGERLLTLEAHEADVNHIAFSPDGSMLATAGEDGTVKVWDADSGGKLLTLDGPEDQFLWPAFSRDGRLLAAPSDEGTVRVWSLDSGRQAIVLQTEPVWWGGGAFSADGRRLAFGVDAARAEVWDITSGERVLTLEGHDEQVIDVDYSPNGELLATASQDGTTKIWDGRTGRELYTLFGHTAPLVAADFNADGTLLATASWDGTAKVWAMTLTGGNEIVTLAGHSRALCGVSFEPLGTRVATADCGGTVRVWDVSSLGAPELFAVPADPVWWGDVAFTADGSRLVASGAEGAVMVWDAMTGDRVLELEGHGPVEDPLGPSVFGIDLSRDGTLIATGSNDQTARVWDAETGQELFTIKRDDWVDDVALHPEGGRVATGGEGVAVWDVASGDELLTLGEGIFESVAFSADGRLLAAGNADDGRVSIWGADTGELRGSLDVGAPIGYVSFSADGARVLTGSGDGTARVWDVEKEQEVLALSGSSPDPRAAAFSPDETRIATGGADGTVKLWDARTGDLLLKFGNHKEVVTAVAFSPDGSRLASISRDGSVRMWVLEIEDLIQIARDRLTRDFRPEECQQYLHLDECPPTS